MQYSLLVFSSVAPAHVYKPSEPTTNKFQPLDDAHQRLKIQRLEIADFSRNLCGHDEHEPTLMVASRALWGSVHERKQTSPTKKQMLS